MKTVATDSILPATPEKPCPSCGAIGPHCHIYLADKSPVRLMDVQPVIDQLMTLAQDARERRSYFNLPESTAFCDGQANGFAAAARILQGEHMIQSAGRFGITSLVTSDPA